MKPIKYTFEETNKIDLGTKVIYKYPSPDKTMDVGLMKVNGRNPENEKMFNIEHDCSFIIYITSGTGTVYADDQKFSVTVGDVVFIPKNNKFAVEGVFEYVTVDTPAYYPEQSEEIVIS